MRRLKNLEKLKGGLKMKKEKGNKPEKIEETKEQLIQSNQTMEAQLRILVEEASLKEVERYRRQHLILLTEQNQVLKGIGLALNRIGMDLENSEGEEDEDTEEVEVNIPQSTEEIEKESEEVEPEIEEGKEEVKEEEIEEEPEPLSKKEEKIQKKIDQMNAKLKKVKEKKK